MLTGFLWKIYINGLLTLIARLILHELLLEGLMIDEQAD